MAVQLSDLGKRTIGGGLLAIVAGIDIWFGGLAFALMLAAAAVLLVREFLRLTVPEMGYLAIILVSMWPLSAIFSFQAVTLAMSLDGDQAILQVLWILMIGVVTLLLLRLMRRWSSWLAFGVVYVGVPLLALQWLRENSDGQGLAYVGWLVMVIIATDCFAYVAGRSIGGAKLAPSISPGKTWSGLAGGVLGAAVTGVLAGGWMVGWPWPALAMLGAAMALLAQSGDLFESWLKRRAGVKDSGTLIPGHGGLLDRLDGYLTATPAFALLVALV